MKDTDKIDITVGDLKRGAEKCETARAVLKEMFPKAFEEEWEDITPRITTTWREIPKYGYEISLHLQNPSPYGETRVGQIFIGDIPTLYLERPEEFILETRIHPISGHKFIRILKRVS